MPFFLVRDKETGEFVSSNSDMDVELFFDRESAESLAHDEAWNSGLPEETFEVVELIEEAAKGRGE